MVGQRTKIYQMSKSELISELEKKGLSTEGKVPELKNRLLEALSNTGSKSSKINTPSQSSRPSRTASIERVPGGGKAKKMDEEFVDPNDIRMKNLIQQHRSRHNNEKTDKEKELRDPTQVRHRENRERHSRSPSERDFGDDLTGIFKHPDDIQDREQKEENRLWEQYKRQFVNQRTYQSDTREGGQNKSHVDFTTEELEIMRELEIKKIRDKSRREEEGRMREAKVRMEYEVRAELKREYEEELRRERQMILEEEHRKFEKYKEYQRKLEEEKLSRETERLRKNYHDDVEYKMSTKPPTPAPRRKERSPEKDRFRERYTYDRRDDRGWYRSEDHGSYGWDDGKHLNPVELIRKWGITFDGEESVLNYVDRVEELSLCSGIHKDRLLKYIPVMFKGVALLWFRNNFKFWRTWNEFIIDLKKAYLPKDFEFRMEEEINARTQKSGERIRVYVTELLTLMRRHGSMSEEKQLYFLYRNLAEPYKMYIKKTAAVSIDAILKDGTDYENDIFKLDKDKHPTLEIPSKKEKKNQPRENHNNQEKDKKKKSVNAVAAEEKYVSRERCWKCRQKRHENGVCNNPPVKFCMFCGILGKWTTECSCPKPRWWTERRQAGRGAARNNQNAGAVVSNSAPVSGQASATSNQQAPVVNQNVNSRVSNLVPSAPVIPCTSSVPDQLMKLDDNRPYLIVEIDGGEYRALADTGTARSYLSTDTWKEIQQRNPDRKLRTTGHVASVAGERLVQITGKVQLEIMVETTPANCKFYVMDNLGTQIILGVDVMKQIGLKMSFEPDEEASSEVYQVYARFSLGMIRQENDDSDEDIHEEEPGRTPEIEPGLDEDSEASDWTEDERPVLMIKDDTIDYAQAFQCIHEELKKFKDVQGPTHLIEHHIRLKPGTEPIKFRYTPKNPAMMKIMHDEVDKMLAGGVIEPSESSWNSPVVLVKKKNKEYRFCIDYCKINEVTVKDAYPLPHVNTMLDKLRNAYYISVIDLKNGYWQVQMALESRPITVFTVPGKGFYQFKVMPFGFTSAPATFQRLLDKVIKPELEAKAGAYLDEIFVIGSSLSEHVKNLSEVFEALREAKLQINVEKSKFLQEQTQYLGHIVGRHGIHTDPEKVKAIVEMSEPQNKGQKWQWEDDQKEAFETVKNSLVEAPVLVPPNFEHKFILQTDASNDGIGAVLIQKNGDRENVIAYASRTLTRPEKNYSTTETECLAVAWAIKTMRMYLEGYSFVVITDHQSLKWLLKLDNPMGRIARWNLFLQQFDFEIEYRKGILNIVADALSRNPIDLNNSEDEDEEEEGVVLAIEPEDRCEWYQGLMNRVREHPERFPDFMSKDDLLYKHVYHALDFTSRQGEAWKLCVPESKRLRVLQENHDIPTAGHLGIMKTIARVAQSYFWPGMQRDIKDYVRHCQRCQEFKIPQQQPAGKMGTTYASYPWEVVSIDLVGPITRSSLGNTVLLVMQNKYSKWVEIKPMRTAKSETVVKILKEAIILRFGCPRVLISDNGSQFTSSVFRDCLREFGIEHQRTPPYAPQCNPVERTNRVIKTMISQYINKNQRSWDKYLPELMFAYNSAVYETTQCTPALLNLGRELEQPKSLRKELEGNRSGVQIDLDERLTRLRDLQDFVKINSARAFTKQSKYYDQKRRDWVPVVGERVAKREHPLSSAVDNFSAKLAPKFTGGYTVKSVISPAEYEIVSDEGIGCLVHIKDLKPDFE
ncbi:uncharacterized protein LOC107045921 [Diachasma alloeum]|uniref:uncharacterized protein LOC107045921 n=1 Tax=Diachasma alloeum TaxID=454923 RepID=UPI000738153A|nr:uncharacterized protein LOC107045921 [Diachasma alloeum]